MIFGKLASILRKDNKRKQKQKFCDVRCQINIIITVWIFVDLYASYNVTIQTCCYAMSQDSCRTPRFPIIDPDMMSGKSHGYSVLVIVNVSKTTLTTQQHYLNINIVFLQGIQKRNMNSSFWKIHDDWCSQMVYRNIKSQSQSTLKL